MTSNLTNEFEALCESKKPNERGRLFEPLFCRLLHKNGFNVRHNAKSAKPRQTDVFADHGDDSFLFELKWQSRRIDISAIAQIQHRLSKVRRGTLGCICSMSGFTESLIQEIEQNHHEFEVLLFNPFELYLLFDDKLNIFELIDEKHRSLRQDGIVWFFRQIRPSELKRYTELPETTERLDATQASIHFHLSSENISDIVFVRGPLILEEHRWAFGLRVDLTDATVDGLKEAFTAVTNYLGLRGGGRFGIRQSGSGWYGLGVENFLKEIERHAERYRGYEGYIHHSEELVFFEELKRGFFLFTGRHRLNGTGLIHSGKITIRLPGMPVDPQPYLKFARILGQENLLFTPEESLRRSAVALSRWIKIEPSDVITKIRQLKANELGILGVSGLVIKNPFFKKSAEIAKLYGAEAISTFAEPEYLICTLDDWHGIGDEVNHYVLTDLEAVTIGEAKLLRPRCTWKKIIGSDQGKQNDERLQLESELKRRTNLLKKIRKASERKALS